LHRFAKRREGWAMKKGALREELGEEKVTRKEHFSARER
jgi:hypothetical protein